MHYVIVIHIKDSGASSDCYNAQWNDTETGQSLVQDTSAQSSPRPLETETSTISD